MSTVGELLVRLGATNVSGLQSDLAQGEAAIGRFGASASPVAAQMTKSFGSIESSIKSLAITSVGFGAAFEIGHFLTDAAKGAVEAEATTARLTAALKANVPAWNGSMAAINAAAAANVHFGISDQETQASLVGLIGSTHSVTEAINVQRIATDLAAYSHVSLQTATDTLTKFEGGRFRGLAALGIQLEAHATKEEALAAVEKIAAGSAEAAANTQAGAQREAAAAMQDAADVLGTAFIPLEREAATIARDVLAPAITVIGQNLQIVAPIAEALAVTMGIKVVAGFAAAGLGALGFGTAALTAAGEAEAAAAREVAAANEAKAAWEGTGAAAAAGAAAGGLGISIGAVVAPLALMAATAGDVTRGVQHLGETIFGTNPAFSQMEDRAHGVTEAVQQQAAAQAQATTAAQAAEVASVSLSDAQTNAAASAALAAAGVHNFAGRTDEETRAALALTVALGTSASATADQKKAAQDAADEFKVLGTVFDGFNAVTVDSARSMDQFGFHAADAMQKASAAFYAAGAAAGALASDLADLPREVQIDVVTTFTQSGAGAFGAGAFGVGAAGASSQDNNPTADLTGTSADPLEVARQQKEAADKAAAAAKSAHDKAVAAANQAIRAHAQAVAEAQRKEAEGWRNLASDAKQATDDMFAKLKASADSYFEHLHQKNLAAIQDIHDKANAALDAEKAANLKPVTEAEAAQKAIIDQRALAKAQADLANAQQEQVGTGSGQVSADQKAQDVLSAQQALADFQAGARIDALKANADAANAEIDIAKGKNDAKLKADQAAENARYNAQITAFNNQLAALKTALDRHPEKWKAAQAEILTLLNKFGADYESAGALLGNDFGTGMQAEVSKLIANAANWSNDLLKAAGLEKLATATVATAAAATKPVNVASHAAGVVRIAQGQVVLTQPAGQASVAPSQVRTAGSTAIAAAASRSVAGSGRDDFARPIVVESHSHIYLDGTEIVDHVDREMYRRAAGQHSGFR